MRLTRDVSFLLPDLVSDRAKDDPHGAFARVPVGPTYTSGFNDVTNSQFSNAINFTASLLMTTYGESKSFETLTYIGSMDIRYSIMVLAGIKTGYKVAGVGMALVMALFHGLVPVYPIPGPPPTTEAFIDAISNTDVDWALVSPVVIDELGKRQDLIRVAASRLKYISYAGGSVPKASGDAVARTLPIWTILGSSEAGLTPFVHDKDGYDNAEDWVYMHFNPALKHEMRHSHDDFYELILVRNTDTDNIQAVFTHFPGAKEFPTRDLFRPHPTKDNLWLYHSRVDDVIVFLNGEKTNPISFEHHIMSHPEVKAALVVGAQRVEAALLIETATDAEFDDDEKAALIERIWPLVEEANKVTPAHARVSKNKILLVDPSIPMARAGKGTVQRAATLALYAAEIEELYQQEESLDARIESTPEMNLKTLVRNAVAEMVSMDDLDFFQLGMDSLGALRLQRVLKRQFPGVHIPNDTVYSNSSVNALVRALEKVTSAPAVPTTNETIKNGSGDGVQTDLVRADSVVMRELTPSTEELERMLTTFTKEIDAISPREVVSAPGFQDKDFIILLTGTTGAIGSYISDALLSRPEIAHVFCLNRTTDAQARQIKNNQARGLVTNFPPERVTFLNGDLTKPSFGLTTDIYDDLLKKVTHVVHNAWPVNFNMPLASFAPSVAGVVSLIRFAAQSEINSSFQFLSSVSSVFNYLEETVPEEIIFDMSTPSAGGYGQSKHLAERLLDHASKRLGIHTSAVRIGQVAGAARTASAWNQQEWFPSLVTTSASMGVLPARLGNGADKVDWIPIDHLSEVLVELALTPQQVEASPRGAAVNHIVHPYPVTWTSILPIVKKTIDEAGLSEQPICIVPYEEWLSVLKTKAIEAEMNTSIDYATLVQKFPSIKLIDFYEGLQDGSATGFNLTLSVKKTSAISGKLAGLEAIQNDWVAGWVEEWLKAAKLL
ncbi:hypothetical protein N0V95_007183 [Ascochyta clinopodiicola]|nr:hypothetical protein N0V95_007183 [Ascochyta clinopodiicola]